MNALAEPASYLLTLALFSFVVQATARVRHEMLLLACIPPVFVAAIMGFVMGIYAGETFGIAPVLIALVIPWPLAQRLGRRWSARDLLISIYLAWAIGLVTALVAVGFPDQPGG
jgi:predicted membrane-bound mannosyltransferase